MVQKTKGIFPITVPTPYPVGPVNLYLIKSDVLTVVDIGPKTEESWNSFNKQLKEIGYTPSDIEQVILTHHHPDHVGMLNYLEEKASLCIAGHVKTRPWLLQDEVFVENFNTYFRKLYQELGVSEQYISPRVKLKNFPTRTDLTHILSEGMEPIGLPGWKVMETPGHAQSHISLYHEKDGIVMGGDHIIGHISSNALIEAPYEEETERVKPLLQYRESLKRFLNLDVSVVYSGHGKPIHDLRQLILHRIEHMDKRANKIKEILKEASLTCFEICKKLFPDVYQKQTDFTMSDTLGHLDLLEARNEVTKTYKGGVLYYSSIQ